MKFKLIESINGRITDQQLQTFLDQVKQEPNCEVGEFSWLLPDGKVLSGCSHHDILWNILKKCFPQEYEEDPYLFNDWVWEWFTGNDDVIFSKLGWIQIGVEHKEIAVKESTTKEQFDAIEKYLDFLFKHGECDFMFYIGRNGKWISKRISLIENTPKEIIRKIKKYIQDGIFYERLMGETI